MTMRLIDADALLETVEERYLSACIQAAPGTRRNGKSIHYGIAIGMNFIRNVINEQPAIEAEPVRNVRWIDSQPYIEALAARRWTEVRKNED
jgi:hypothetical protein